jgi:nitronate monooxygenase
MRKVLELEDKKADINEILPLIAGTHGDDIWEKGNMDAGSINVGQSIGLIHETVSCQELIDQIVQEAEEVIGQVRGKM